MNGKKGHKIFINRNITQNFTGINNNNIHVLLAYVYKQLSLFFTLSFYSSIAFSLWEKIISIAYVLLYFDSPYTKIVMYFPIFFYLIFLNVLTCRSFNFLANRTNSTLAVTPIVLMLLIGSIWFFKYKSTNIMSSKK